METKTTERDWRIEEAVLLAKTLEKTKRTLSSIANRTKSSEMSGWVFALMTQIETVLQENLKQ